MEAGGPRSQGLGSCQEACPNVNSSQRRHLLQNTEPLRDPGSGRVSPGGEGSARLRGSAGAVQPSAGGLGAGGATPQEGLLRARNPCPTLTLALPLSILVPAIRVGGPRPRSGILPAHILPRCPSFPTSRSGPSSPQHNGLCWEGHCSRSSQMLRATPDLLLSEE